MKTINNKKSDFARLIELNEEIQNLTDESSLATLDHKLTLRQELLEYLFSNYKNEFDETDIEFIKKIMLQNKELLAAMLQNKEDRSEKIIKGKNSRKRARIYTSIAKQK